MAMADLSRAASALQGLLRNPKAGAEEVRRAQSAGKRALLQEGLLVPSGTAPVNAHKAARYILEASALLALRAHDWDGFGRYWGALAPFYELGRTAYPPGEARGQRAKITGLYLLFLLTEGDYAGFHTLIEALQAESDDGSNDDDDSDDDDSDSDSDSDDDEKGPIIRNHSVMYPIMMERCLMEGSYDRVWELAKDKRLPSEEFGVFSQVLIRTIREEIASCSEKAYPSIPVQNAKNLLFLSSEGAVVSFAQERGWTVRDGRIYFPAETATASSDHSPSGDGDDDDDDAGKNARSRSAAPPMPSSSSRNEREILAMSGTVIENTIGYARELETIV